MVHFWESDAGESVRIFRRRMARLLVKIPLEPPTKKARVGTRRKATDAVRAAFEASELVAYGRARGEWPRPRAHIALDISITSIAREGARIDNICKWLLDELAGHVYTDDRQVKLLFARVWRPSPSSRPPVVPGGDDVRHDPLLLDSLPRDREPSVWITAQRRSAVTADLRAAARLEDRWDPFDDDYGVWHRDPLEADFYRDELVDYQSIFDPSIPEDLPKYEQIGRQIRFLDQTQQQRLVDLTFSSLFVDLPVDRFGIWNRVRPRLAFSPYIFDLGQIPSRGESELFQQRLRRTLQERRERYPHLLPLKATTGISMILFEHPGQAKDLDNLVRDVLPAIVDILRPPRTSQHGWIAEGPNLGPDVVDVPFIEVAAIPAEKADMPPGSLVLGLSSGYRVSSWWSQVARRVEESLQDAYPE